MMTMTGMMAVLLVPTAISITSAAFQPIPTFSSSRGIPNNNSGRGARSLLVAVATSKTDDAKESSTTTVSTTATTTTTMTSSSSRRSIISATAASILVPFTTGWMPIINSSSSSSAAHAATTSTKGENNGTSMYAPKFVQTYEDFVTMPEGWSYKDVKLGSNEEEWKDGDRVVFDWSGYTIGYFGRPFEAKGGPQGGAFDKDINYFRTTLGSHTIIPGLESALRTMKVGGIRQVIIPYGSLSYPPRTDMEHDVVGPKPTTFSGMRALNFVLENERVDRTLLFNVKLVRVDRSDGRGGFARGGGGGGGGGGGP